VPVHLKDLPEVATGPHVKCSAYRREYQEASGHGDMLEVGQTLLGSGDIAVPRFANEFSGTLRVEISFYDRPEATVEDADYVECQLYLAAGAVELYRASDCGFLGMTFRDHPLQCPERGASVRPVVFQDVTETLPPEEGD